MSGVEFHRLQAERCGAGTVPEPRFGQRRAMIRRDEFLADQRYGSLKPILTKQGGDRFPRRGPRQRSPHARPIGS